MSSSLSLAFFSLFSVFFLFFSFLPFPLVDSRSFSYRGKMWSREGEGCGKVGQMKEEGD